MTKLSLSGRLKAEGMGLLAFFVFWKVGSIIIFFGFLFLGGDTSDSSFISGLAIIPGALAYWKTESHFVRKYRAKLELG